MTLSEIEIILAELSKRHENLDKELLVTLLEAAGWEQSVVRDAVTLFKQGNYKTLVVTGSSSILSRANIRIEEPVKKIELPQDQKSQEVQSPKAVQSVAAPVAEEPKPFSLEVPPLVIAPAVGGGGDLTYYQPDGSEEGNLPVFEDVEIKRENTPIVLPKPSPVADVVEKKETIEKVPEVAMETPVVQVIEQTPEPLKVHEDVPLINNETPESDTSITENKPAAYPADIANVEVPVIPVLDGVQVVSQDFLPKETEPVSLVVSEEPKVKREEEEPPHNLPLLPFESSPHVWSFARYKDVFHADDASSKKEQTTQSTAMFLPSELAEIQKEAASQKKEEETPEISLEVTPMTKGDESLVFLAGIMLFVIILILGYMYGQGRL